MFTQMTSRKKSAGRTEVASARASGSVRRIARNAQVRSDASHGALTSESSHPIGTCLRLEIAATDTKQSVERTSNRDNSTCFRASSRWLPWRGHPARDCISYFPFSHIVIPLALRHRIRPAQHAGRMPAPRKTAGKMPFEAQGKPARRCLPQLFLATRVESCSVWGMWPKITGGPLLEFSGFKEAI